MYSKLRIRKGCASVLFLLFIAVAPNIHGQQEKTRGAERERLITAAREIIVAARYCALITLDAAGHPQVRTMDPFAPGQDMVIWLGTNQKSRKVAEIRLNHRVALYYFDATEQSYVTISGIARLVNDPQEKAKRWKDEWKAFYPDRDKNYLLIAVSPDKLEVVSEKKGITGDKVNWDPPLVRFRPGRAN